MPVSCHTHSGQFCTHGCGTLEEIVCRAIELGFTHYGLSEHMPRYHTRDLYQNEIEENLSPNDLVEMFDQYVSEARKLQKKHKGQIDLIVGMETEYISKETTDRVKELRARYSLDYLVGSIHHADGLQIDYSEEEYCISEEKCGGTEAIMLKYYDQQYEMMKEIKPEVIGHFDLISLYRKSFQLSEAIWDKIKRNIDYGVSYGALFEVNSACRPGNPFPRSDVLKVLKASGAMLTISDDSHYPGGVGWCYGQLSRHLQSFDIHDIFYLESCTDESGHVTPGTTTLKKMSNCWGNSFWANEKLLMETWCD